MNIRLEYSPLLGQFNQAKANDRPDEAKGFKTLCCFVSSDRAARFIEAVVRKFPVLDGHGATQFPALQEIKTELLHFIEEDVKLLQQHMSSTFQRRSSILNHHP